MNGNTAVAVSGPARVGVMVRSATSIYIYWRGAPGAALRLVDLSGRPRHELLDGCGERRVAVSEAEGGVYVDDLLPGHLYYVEAGTLGAGPVQTPWRRPAEGSGFPEPYHRS